MLKAVDGMFGDALQNMAQVLYLGCLEQRPFSLSFIRTVKLIFSMTFSFLVGD